VSFVVLDPSTTSDGTKAHSLQTDANPKGQVAATGVFLPDANWDCTPPIKITYPGNLISTKNIFVNRKSIYSPQKHMPSLSNYDGGMGHVSQLLVLLRSRPTGSLCTLVNSTPEYSHSMAPIGL
jgi:hypothetical protein